MSDEFTMTISIPTDNEGYVLQKCPKCGTYFKITPSDMRDDRILEIYCPCCGLTSDNYFTDDVIELALAMAENKAMDMLHDELKKMERKTRNSVVSFKAGRPPKHKFESPIRAGIEAMEVVKFPCCNLTAKIKPLLKITGCYCPFCGVKNYEVE